MPLFALEPQVWTVSELNRQIRQLLESEYRLQDLWVTGEVSNISRPSSGHLYFRLKDAHASLRCVMWRPNVLRLAQIPQEGQAIEAHGRIGVYEDAGQYQLYVDTLRAAGEGILYQKFMQLKAQLEAQGLFDPERKRPLPKWPRKIGVVTSPTAAALRDVLNVLRRRYPLAEVILSPTPVQGEEAPDGIVQALRAINRYAQPDVILLVRGGGSMEDLWAFNDEQVAREIAASQAPVVSGVGHEIDYTIADFVADQRAPTPSAAAEIATPDSTQLSLEIHNRLVELIRSFSALLRELRLALQQRQLALQRSSPGSQIARSRLQVDERMRKITSSMLHSLALRREGTKRLAQTLNAVGPQAVLARGFSIVQRADDRRLVRSTRQVAPGDRLHIRVSDGTFDAESIEERKS